jgi:hypothetical protein
VEELVEHPVDGIDDQHVAIFVGGAVLLQVVQRLPAQRPPLQRRILGNRIRPAIGFGGIHDLHLHPRLVRGDEDERHVQIDPYRLLPSDRRDHLVGIRMNRAARDVLIPWVVLGKT